MVVGLENGPLIEKTIKAGINAIKQTNPKIGTQRFKLQGSSYFERIGCHCSSV